MKKISISFLIPAYNDESTIEEVVGEADRLGRSIAESYEVVVCNDGSRDRTGEILRKLSRMKKSVRVMEHAKNKGYGQTVKDLYYAGKRDWLFCFPGDNQIPAGEVNKLIPYMTQADMILGHRVNRNDPPDRLRQSRIYNLILRILFGIKLKDINSVRLMKRSMMQKISISSGSAFVDAELAIRAMRQGYRVIEAPIDHRARDSEMGAGGGKLSTILPVIKEMIVFKIKMVGRWV